MPGDRIALNARRQPRRSAHALEEFDALCGTWRAPMKPGWASDIVPVEHR
jgi:hypothetical protein